MLFDKITRDDIAKDVLELSKKTDILFLECATGVGKSLLAIKISDLLTKDEIAKASEICTKSGTDFLKTSTGFVKGGVGATIENVAHMKTFCKNVKASGGIKTRAQAIELIEAGATRLGTSSGVDLVKE